MSAKVSGAPVGSPLPQLRFRPLQIRILALVLLLYVLDGIDTQVLSVAVAALARDWGLALPAFGTAMAAGYAGSAVGALIGGMLGDRFGRKPTAIAGVVLFGASTLMMVLMHTPQGLAIVRFMAGIGLGGCLPPCLALLTECMPRARHGFAVSLAMLCHPVGISLTGLAAATVLPVFGWQWLFAGAGLLPLLAAGVLLVALPESPVWIGRDASMTFKAKALLERLGLPDTELAAARNNPWGRQFVTLFARPGRGGVIGLLVGFFFVYLAMTMVLSWLPALLTHAGYSAKVAGSGLFVWSIAGVLGIFLAGVLAGRFSVGPVLLGHLIGAVVFLATLGLVLPAIQGRDLPVWFYLLLALGGYMMNGSMTSLYALAANSFAPAVRASGIGLSSMLGRVGGIVGALVGAQAFGLLGSGGFFALVVGSVVLALLGLLAGGSVRTGFTVPVTPVPMLAPAEPL